MNNTLLADKTFSFPVIVRPLFERSVVAESNGGNSTQRIRFMVRFCFRLVLNNLSLDYMSGEELFNYLQAFLATSIIHLVTSKQKVADIMADACSQNVTCLNAHEFVKKVNRLLVKNPFAKAA